MVDVPTCSLLALEIQAAIGGAAGIARREDARAFGAMLEAQVAAAWPSICHRLGAEPLSRPGARTIYDLALRHNGALIGLDLKTKDLDSGRYSDGGICAVANLLRFLVHERGIFLIGEIAHAEGNGTRNIRAVRVAPLHLMPTECLRIENLGTGQVRLDTTGRDPWSHVAWDRPLSAFLDAFTSLAIAHYAHVGAVAKQRSLALERFRTSGFTHLRLK